MLLPSEIRSILLVENEPLIAMDVEAMLSTNDVGRISHVLTCGDAEKWLAENTPDLVILDVYLRDGPSTGIARLLVERGIPFFVYSGDTQNSASYRDRFHQAIWLTKPCTQGELLSAIKQTLAGR